MKLSNVPLPNQQRLALGPVRHACHSCGTCCTGWRVSLRTLSERMRVTEQAQALGIDDAVVDGAIRRVDGACVFLRDDRLCAIHARFGEDAKPSVCKNFPRRARASEDGIRIGADPGCSSTWRTFADGPVIEPWPVSSSVAFSLPPELAQIEREIIGLTRVPDMTIAGVAAGITGDARHLPGLDPAFVGRLLSRLAHAAPHLGDHGNGSMLNQQLAPLARFLLHFDAERVPHWSPPPPLIEAYALETLARHLFLRLGDDSVPPMVHALLVLGGILSAAYVDPTPAVFGPALAAWSRLCRVVDFWLPVMPNLAMGMSILRGTPLPERAPQDAT